jgi:hypothetical protein
VRVPQTAHIIATRFLFWTGTDPDDGVRPMHSQPSMHPLTGQLAAVMASTDAVPRLVRQFTALFLVTPDDATGDARYSPSSDPNVRARVFIGSGPRPEIRVYGFVAGEPRSIAAERLYEQLSAAISDP